MSETALPTLAPARARTAALRRPSAPDGAVAPSVWNLIARRLLAALHAHARRQIVLALGERVTVLNQAIRNGAEARRQLEHQQENQQ